MLPLLASVNAFPVLYDSGAADEWLVFACLALLEMVVNCRFCESGDWDFCCCDWRGDPTCGVRAVCAEREKRLWPMEIPATVLRVRLPRGVAFPPQEVLAVVMKGLVVPWAGWLWARGDCLGEVVAEWLPRASLVRDFVKLKRGDDGRVAAEEDFCVPIVPPVHPLLLLLLLLLLVLLMLPPPPPWDFVIAVDVVAEVDSFILVGFYLSHRHTRDLFGGMFEREKKIIYFICVLVLIDVAVS